MKILLCAINAKYIHSNLAVYSLRAYAERYRDQIEIAEFTINHYADDIMEEIYKKTYKLFCSGSSLRDKYLPQRRRNPHPEAYVP